MAQVKRQDTKRKLWARGMVMGVVLRPSRPRVYPQGRFPATICREGSLRWSCEISDSR